ASGVPGHGRPGTVLSIDGHGGLLCMVGTGLTHIHACDYIQIILEFSPEYNQNTNNRFALPPEYQPGIFFPRRSRRVPARQAVTLRRPSPDKGLTGHLPDGLEK